jgi:hypothetical protein
MDPRTGGTLPTMSAYKRRPKKPRAELSVEQREMAAQFSDYAFDYPTLSFDEVARKFLGPKPFPATPTGRKFRSEAEAVFDQERGS